MNIISFINKFKVPDRDKLVAERINKWLNDNIEGMNDGLVENFIMMGNTVANDILSIYSIDKSEWEAFQKTNSELKKGYVIIQDLLNVCLMTSYNDTKNILFLDIIMVRYAGSKLSNYFPFRTSPAYVNRMRYTIEKVLPVNSNIRKEGNLYGALRNILDSNINGSAIKDKINKLDVDHNITYILGRLRTAVNDIMKSLKKAFIKAENNALTFNKDMTDDDSSDITEIATKTTTVSKLNYIIDNYDASNYDYNLFKLLNVKTAAERIILQGMLDSEDKLFAKTAKFMINAYMNDLYTDMTTMQKEWLSVMSMYRFSKYKKELQELDAELLGAVVKIQQDAGIAKGDFSLADRLRFVPLFRKYVILKIRVLISKI